MGKGQWAIAVQGGAGDIPIELPKHIKDGRESALRHCLDIGSSALNQSHSSLHVVELVVRELENHPLFNAGRGSVLTTEGTIEMEASIMDGKTKKCGSVCGLKTVVNPISLARLVMEKTPHVYLGFEGAEAFAREQGVATMEPCDFITPANVERLKQFKESTRVQLDNVNPIQNEAKVETHNPDGDSQLGTVGCVAVDLDGHLAAATSTGGVINKWVGRIGDTPIIGSGTYANTYCAVSATGSGEDIIRGTVARDVAALMEYKGLSLKEAASYVVKIGAPECKFGLVAVSATGEIAMPFGTTGMFRACATQDGYSEIAIH
ncbi:unnamed protein product [Amaranthus hypochondriacus]